MALPADWLTRRRALTAATVVVMMLLAADAVQNPTVVARRIEAQLPAGAERRLALAHPIQLQQVRHSVLNLLAAVDNGERIREDQVVAEAGQATLERAKRDAADLVAGRPQAWMTGGVLAGGGYTLPAVGVLTSGFGPRWGTFHAGIDIAGPIGTPIYACAAGVVVDAGPAQGFGLWVRIRHADGTVSVYGHLYDFFVSAGEQVPAGIQIGRMGNRGDSTGPHLHFEVHPAGGPPTDPLVWFASHGVRVTD